MLEIGDRASRAAAGASRAKAVAVPDRTDRADHLRQLDRPGERELRRERDVGRPRAFARPVRAGREHVLHRLPAVPVPARAAAARLGHQAVAARFDAAVGRFGPVDVACRERRRVLRRAVPAGHGRSGLRPRHDLADLAVGAAFDARPGHGRRAGGGAAVDGARRTALRLAAGHRQSAGHGGVALHVPRHRRAECRPGIRRRALFRRPAGQGALAHGGRTGLARPRISRAGANAAARAFGQGDRPRSLAVALRGDLAADHDRILCAGLLASAAGPATRNRRRANS